MGLTSLSTHQGNVQAPARPRQSGGLRRIHYAGSRAHPLLAP